MPAVRHDANMVTFGWCADDAQRIGRKCAIMPLKGQSSVRTGQQLRKSNGYAVICGGLAYESVAFILLADDESTG